MTATRDRARRAVLERQRELESEGALRSIFVTILLVIVLGVVVAASIASVVFATTDTERSE